MKEPDDRETGVAFVKAEANGNDFLLVEAGAVPAARRPALARAMCARHRGIGGDGVEFFAWQNGGLQLVLINADGSEAEISGNGTRCAVAWCARQHGAQAMRVRTVAGEKQARVLGREGESWTIELGMGAPGFASERIPMRLPEGARAQVREYSVLVGTQRLAITALSMGNPQCCVLVEEFPAEWERLGAALESHPLFPRHTNVEFVRPLDPHTIEIRIYERGVGVTESSGTGSCAAAVAAILAAKAQSPVRVLTPGGEQEVVWEGGEVWLRGPARLVAMGRFLGD